MAVLVLSGACAAARPRPALAPGPQPWPFRLRVLERRADGEPRLVGELGGPSPEPVLPSHDRWFVGTPIDDQVVPLLRRLPRLRFLDLRRTAISPVARATLARPGLSIEPLATQITGGP
jgi:hypothetical protein